MRELKLSDITEPIVVIKINNSYREGMSEEALYDCTRGCWRNRMEYVASAKYALATVFGEVKEVYEIERWVKNKDLHRKTIPYDAKADNRIGFEGKLAPERVREKYIGLNVNGIIKSSNPLLVIKPK